MAARRRTKKSKLSNLEIFGVGVVLFGLTYGGKLMFDKNKEKKAIESPGVSGYNYRMSG